MFAPQAKVAEFLLRSGRPILTAEGSWQMFVEFEKEVRQGPPQRIGVNVNHVFKVEPKLKPQDPGGKAITTLYYINGQTEHVIGDLQTTLKRLNGEIGSADVTSLG